MTTQRTARFLWVVAIATIALVLAVNVAIFTTMGHLGQMRDEAGVLFIQCMIAAAPYIAFAIILRPRPALQINDDRPVRTAAITGFAMNAFTYLLLWADAYRAHKSQGSGGANIGLGILAMCIPILVAILLARAYSRARSTN